MMSECMTSLKVRMCAIKHPILTILVLGLAIRFLMMFLAFSYDTNYWAVVTRNIQMGEGLYGVRGYYYTPVWGYVLGLTSMFDTFFFDIGELGVRVMEFVGLEDAPGTMPVSANATSFGFMFSYKMVLLVFDVILAYLMYWLIGDITKNRTKANAAFLLTFLCPSIFSVLTIFGMPDEISSTMVVLSIILLRRDHPFLAGSCYAVAILNKFFPIFIFFPLVAYAFSRCHDKKAGLKDVGLASAGTLLMVTIIMFPLILNGDIMSAFYFLTSRATVSSDPTLFDFLKSYGAILVTLVALAVSFILSVRSVKNDVADPLDRFMKHSMISLAVMFLYPSNPQYMIIIFPFLIYCILTCSKSLLRSWGLLGFGGLVQSLSTLAMLLSSIAAYTTLVSPEFIVSAFRFMDGVLPVTYMVIIGAIGTVLQYVGILLILYVAYRSRLYKADISHDST